MVQRRGFGEFQQLMENHSSSMLKLKVEDQLEEENGPLDKKTKIQWNKDLEMVPPQSLQDSLLEEPSPLGLRLRKSPSLLDLVQSKLSQENSVSSSNATCNFGFEGGKKKKFKSTAACGTNNKLKASNFSASLLRIGSWELARQPRFFRENNPQPRKHTSWEAISDFTGGQASIHRRHFIQCPSGLFNRHFEKLIQCDPRLNSLSQQTEIKLDSTYFDTQSSVFKDRDGYSRCRGFGGIKGGFGPNFRGFLDHVLDTTTQSTSSNNEVRVPIVRALDSLPTKIISSSSAMDNYCTKNKSASSANKKLSNNSKPYDRIGTPVHNSSMSKSKLVNHIGNCISGKAGLDKTLFENDSSLDEMAQKLLSDSQLDSNLDEQSLMKKVNSFCSLIQQNESMVGKD